VSADSESKIQQLCTAILAASTEPDVQRMIPQLREALQEHVRLAKASLQDQAVAIAVLDTSKTTKAVADSKIVSESRCEKSPS
jgi:F0F1-type ATP synthase membrane subunit b/b'